MDTFDMEQWKNDYDRYKYNKDYLGFDLSLKMKEGKAKIKTNALPAVKKDLIPLLEAIINQGNLYALIPYPMKELKRQITSITSNPGFSIIPVIWRHFFRF